MAFSRSSALGLHCNGERRWWIERRELLASRWNSSIKILVFFAGGNSRKLFFGRCARIWELLFSTNVVRTAHTHKHSHGSSQCGKNRYREKNMSLDFSSAFSWEGKRWEIIMSIEVEKDRNGGNYKEGGISSAMKETGSRISRRHLCDYIIALYSVISSSFECLRNFPSHFSVSFSKHTNFLPCLHYFSARYPLLSHYVLDQDVLALLWDSRLTNCEK